MTEHAYLAQRMEDLLLQLACQLEQGDRVEIAALEDEIFEVECDLAALETA
nr:hypothetical protein [Anaerolineae bacterium]